MKLASNMVERTLDQFEAEPLAENHPAVSRLSEVFGDHTFFLDGDGLHIVEPAEPKDSEGRTGNVVRVARWNDATCTSLTPHEPEKSNIVIDLG